MRRILAISGGVDSMTMLDIFVQRFPHEELVVAHFDHGVRKNSSKDAEFVRRRAEKYGIDVAIGYGGLGADISEEKARMARYDFLRKVAAEKEGEIYTAHHLDDLVGSVAINLLRGTGWRGLAVMGATDIHRPFLEDYAKLGLKNPPTKKDLLRYAGDHELCFREDQTNSWDEYLRNRLYHQVNNFDKKMAIFNLWQKQKNLRERIESLLLEVIPTGTWPRGLLREMDDEVAIEVLRMGLMRQKITATRPQLRNFLKAIREYAPGKYFNLPNDRLVRINKNNFTI